MGRIQVKIAEYGVSDENESYYVTYHVTDLDKEVINKLKQRLEDSVEIRGDDIFITTYFAEKFYPFKSEESQKNPEDYIAREELEMTAYLLDLLED